MKRNAIKAEGKTPASKHLREMGILSMQDARSLRGTSKFWKSPEKKGDASALFAGADAADCLVTLVRRIYEVHNDPRYAAVWSLAQLHGGPYSGPQFGKELAAAAAVVTQLTNHQPEVFKAKSA